MQNKENVDVLQENLQAVIPHLYDDNSLCETQSRCHHKDYPTRKFKILPRGKPLTNEQGKQKVLDLFNNHIENAKRLASSEAKK